MQIPEKIYISDFGSELSYDWHTEHCFGSDIEYIRTDAFIEKKAVKWLKENGGTYWMDDYDLPTDDLVNDFKKNYIRGE